MNKFFVYIAAAIAFVIIAFYFTADLQASFKENIEKSICYRSVHQHALLKFNGLDFSSEVLCPTKEIDIDYSLKDKKDQEKAKRTIADSIKTCHNNFGNGTLNLFNGEGVFCAVCSLIRFEKPKENITGFVKFFYTEKPKGSDKTYGEEIVGVTKGEMFSGENKYAVQNDTIDTSKTYAVMFYYPKGQDNIRKISKTIGVSYKGVLVGGGAIVLGLGLVKVGAVLTMTKIGAFVGIPVALVGGAIIGVSAAIGWFSTEEADEWAGFTYLMPYEKDKALKGCDYLPAKQGEWWEET